MRLRLRDGDHERAVGDALGGDGAAAMRLRLRDGDHAARQTSSAATAELQCGSVSGTEITGRHGGSDAPLVEHAAMRLRLRDGDHVVIQTVVEVIHTDRCNAAPSQGRRSRPR